MSTHPIEVMTGADLPAAFDCMSRAFGTTFPPEARERMSGWLELDRMMVARDGGLVIGTAGAYSLRMTVPGGQADVAGVTMVGVAPTHRRRGVLGSMMTRQLAELAADGEAVAALWASETGIYQRYGYGLGALRQRYRLPLAGSAFRPQAQALVEDFALGGRIRWGNWPADDAVLPAVYDQVLGVRPGTLVRPAGGRSWQRLVLAGALEAPQIIVAERPDGACGYAVYRTLSDPGAAADFDRHGEVNVVEVMATDAATYAALWRFLCDLDLMTELVATNRPVPDPLMHLLVDHRRLHAMTGDSLWVRIVDIARALAERSFAAPLDVVIAVSDEVMPANAGRWRIVVPSAGSCATATAVPDGDNSAVDLALDIADLGAAHLGAIALAELALAGRVVEHTPGALAAASAAWSWSPAAWCPEIF